MRILACLLLAASITSTTAVDLVLTNDDWPTRTKDDYNTFDAKMEDEDWFIQYRMLTFWRNAEMNEWRRVDEVEGGLLFRRMFDIPDDFPLGVAVLVQGDFDGQSMQQSVHKLMGGDSIINVPYDDSIARIGLWYHQRVESDIGDWKLDGKFYNDRMSLRLDYSHTCTIAGYELTAGAFGRVWFETTEDRVSEEINRKLCGFGAYGQIVYNSMIFNFSAAMNDVRGGIGFRF